MLSAELNEKYQTLLEKLKAEPRAQLDAQDEETIKHLMQAWFKKNRYRDFT